LARRRRRGGRREGRGGAARHRAHGPGDAEDRRHEAIRRIRAADASAKIIVLTSFADNDKVFRDQSGASSYLMKDVSPQDLARAIGRP
jgi:DNA-binding NarL/FixJ family response regulator